MDARQWLIWLFSKRSIYRIVAISITVFCVFIFDLVPGHRDIPRPPLNHHRPYEHQALVHVSKTEERLPKRTDDISVLSGNLETRRVRVHSTDEEQTDKETDIIIVSYQRSGSSFLSKVIGWRDDAFFWFEPLNKGREWSYLKGNNLLCDMRKPSCVKIPPSSPTSSEEAIRVVDDIFKCNLTRPMASLTEINFYSGVHAPNWSPFTLCLRDKQARYYSPECLNYLEKPCRASKHRVTKLLRISLEEIAKLLETNPRLKIVHLFRDPRAVVNSHLNTPWYSMWLKSKSKIEDDVQVLCTRMESDITSAKSLVAKYPNKVKVVQYEDFDNLTGKVEKLYKFLNMDFSEKYQSYISGLIKTSDDGRYGFHPSSYRQKLPWYVVEIINRHCSSVHRLLGLREFKTEQEFKNNSLSTINAVKLPFRIT